MRRIATAIGPVLALVAIAVPTAPAHSSVPRATDTQVVQTRDRVTSNRVTTDSSRTLLRGIGLDTASLGTTYVNVSWNWIKAATGYKIEVARTSDFSTGVTTQSKRNSARRPAGGREATVVGHLRDATYYWVRVRKMRGTHRSAWSAPVKVATRAHIPDRFQSVHSLVPSAAGTTKIRWRTEGGHTDLFRITTALSRFGSKTTPAVGRNSMTFTVDGDRRSLTLSPEQTAAAGAGIGTGRHLFYRIVAVRKGSADTATRRYPFMMQAQVAGQASTGTGTLLRYAAYNMHVATKDVAGHPWKDRQHLIAANIAQVNPAVAGIEELMPGMWVSDDGGAGLDAALRQAGAPQYELTRTTPYWSGAGQDTRILYDSSQVRLVDPCDETKPSCYIPLPDPLHQHVAAYALFQLPSGEEFYFISAHLSAGNDAKTDKLRGEQAKAISEGIAQINQHNLPVVIATDANSSQTSAGVDSPHTAWLNAGWYDTISAARVVNGQYNSVNHYQSPEEPSVYGFGSMYDTIMTLNMPGADLWKQVITGAPWPSDHNMVYADVRLPGAAP
jgi:endonuclease/exonuclease/phosphatase family metal-dependent hydrolase